MEEKEIHINQEKPLRIYSASAGSGKTYTLAKQYIQMLFDESMHITRGHRSILAVTFTKKATAEMKERILKNLFELAHEEYDSPLLNEEDQSFRLFCQQIGLKDDAAIRSCAQNVLKDLLQDYSMFSISTIDSFFQQIVRSFAKEINLHGGYNLELNADQVIKKAVDDIFFNLTVNDPMFNWLVDSMTHNMEDSGSWELKSDIIQLSKQLVNEDFQRDASNSVLAYSMDQLTAYRDQMWQIYRDYKKQEAELCQQGIRAYQKVGIKGDPNEIFKQHTISYLHKENKDIKDYNLAENAKSFYKIKSINDILKPKSDIIGLVQTAWDNGLSQSIAGIIQLYNTSYKQFVSSSLVLEHLTAVAMLPFVAHQIKTDNEILHRLPIADTNQKLASIINDSDTPFIYQKIGQQLHHFLLDEFQDTSAMQWSNFLPLIRESIATGNIHTKDLIVGDVKQSIYRWRNSDWKLLYNGIQSQIPSEQIDQQTMIDNYRSSRTIVQFNNEFFKSCSQTLATRYTEETANETQADILKEIYKDLEQNPKKNLPGHVKIQFIKDFKEGMPEQLVNEIKLLKHKGFRKIAILIRKNSEAENIVNILTNNEISVTSKEGLLINKAASVQLIMAQLRYFNNPSSKKIKFERNYYYTKIHDELSVEEQLDIILSDENVLLKEIDDALVAAKSKPLFQLVQDISIVFNLPSIVGEQLHLQAFMDEVYNYCKTNDADIYSFIQWWNDYSNIKYVPTPDNDDAIQIVTIHKSKGLEFDAVIIPSCNWDMGISGKEILWCDTHQVVPFNQLTTIPIQASPQMRNSIFAEEYKQELFNCFVDNLNLTYVAFTRPKQELIIFAKKPAEKSTSFAINNLLYQQLDHDTNDCYERDDSAILNNTNIGEKLVKKECQKSAATEPSSSCDSNKKKNAKKEYKKSESCPLDLSHSYPVFHSIAIKKRFEDSAYIQEGNLLHDILSHIQTTTDLGPALDLFLRNGQLNENTYKEKYNELTELFAWLKELGYDWFEGNYEVANEIEFIGKEVQYQRADRVMIAPEKVIVIDYKSGQIESIEYQKQVQKYMKALKKIYPSKEIKGYLLYTNQRKIQEISL